MQLATRAGFSRRTKVNFIWLGTTLRLEARGSKLELRPTPQGIVAAFVYSAISPMEHEINELTTQVPRWRAEIGSGKGSVGRVAQDLHLSYNLSGTGSKSLTSGLASGALGAGKEVLSAVSSLLIVVILTVYFLAALPSIKRFAVHLVPQSRRERFALLLDDVLAGVGGYLLANLFTSLIAGLGTYVWATAFGIPYAILLGLLVSVMGQLGDLVKSLFKRNMEIKDSGHVLPGHGGFLDRMDSLAFAGVTVFLFACMIGA